MQSIVPHDQSVTIATRIPRLCHARTLYLRIEADLGIVELNPHPILGPSQSSLDFQTLFAMWLASPMDSTPLVSLDSTVMPFNTSVRIAQLIANKFCPVHNPPHLFCHRCRYLSTTSSRPSCPRWPCFKAKESTTHSLLVIPTFTYTLILIVLIRQSDGHITKSGSGSGMISLSTTQEEHGRGSPSARQIYPSLMTYNFITCTHMIYDMICDVTQVNLLPS